MDRSGDLLPGTFEMLVLKAVSLGDMHGWGIAERIERLSGGVCGVQQGTV
jgi:PadR family transcriptional regulator PadR